MKSDAALIRRAQSDAGAFRQLYDRYAAAVYGFHVRRTGDEDAALELTAETFARVWLSRARFRDEANGSAAPWIFGVARNVLAQSARARRLERSACARLGVLERLGREPASVEPSDAWLAGLDEALDGLPDGQRKALELRIVADLGYEEVAQRLGTTPAAARVRVARGLGHLRQRLAGQKERAD